jgi:uncharacterized membrane protein
MQRSFYAAASAAAFALVAVVSVAPAWAISLDEACNRLASRMQEAQASGDAAKVRKVYDQGTQRIQSRFGKTATCPAVKPPA